MRSIGLDVHRDFCEVPILDSCGGRARGRIATTPQDLELFAQSLAADDRVALEVTGNAWEIARIIEPHAARVVVVSPSDTGIRQARAKTDRLDALALAKLLAARTRAKNEIHAVLVRRLKGRPPASDLFGVKGRQWLAGLELPVEEAETVDAGVRHIAFLDGELAEVERGCLTM